MKWVWLIIISSILVGCSILIVSNSDRNVIYDTTDPVTGVEPGTKIHVAIDTLNR